MFSSQSTLSGLPLTLDSLNDNQETNCAQADQDKLSDQSRREINLNQVSGLI